MNTPSNIDDNSATPAPLEVRSLELPAGARRVWSQGHDLRVRDLDGYGPKGYVPAGYVAPGVVICEQNSSLTSSQVAWLGKHFASQPDARALIPDHSEATGGFGCIHCGQQTGLPHARDCRHFGKDVGDKVR